MRLRGLPLNRRLQVFQRTSILVSHIVQNSKERLTKVEFLPVNRFGGSVVDGGQQPLVILVCLFGFEHEHLEQVVMVSALGVQISEQLLQVCEKCHFVSSRP